jgi:hypothetical protein
MNGSAAPESEHDRAEQLARNVRWLIGRLDAIHDCLCPLQWGTWQERADQSVEAAKKVAALRLSQANPKVVPKRSPK